MNVNAIFQKQCFEYTLQIAVVNLSKNLSFYDGKTIQLW